MRRRAPSHGRRDWHHRQEPIALLVWMTRLWPSLLGMAQVAERAQVADATAGSSPAQRSSPNPREALN
jgi:hypothetical protein